MIIACIILGILFIIFGIICMSSPIGTFMSTMTMLAAMLLTFGVFGIIRFFKRRALVPELIASILAVLIGFYYLFRPESAAAEGLDRAVLFLTAAWFLFKGCVSVYYSIKSRFVNNRWILIFISGLLSIALGIYSFMSPAVAAASIGILVGMWYIDCGVDLIALGTTAGYIQGAVDATKENILNAAQEIRNSAAAEMDALKARTSEPAETPAEPVEIKVEDPKQPEE